MRVARQRCGGLTALGAVVGVVLMVTGCGDDASVRGPTFAPSPGPGPDPAVELSVVYFPEGACDGRIELGTAAGLIAGATQFVEPESCVALDALTASQLQVRCVDPTGARPSSTWVGPTQPSTRVDASACASTVNF